MNRRFAEFEGKPNRTSIGELRVTLSDKGVILLNAKAAAALNTPAAVTLHYNEDERIIAIKPVDERRRNAFPLRQKYRHQYRLIYASPFCRHFRIKVAGTVMFNHVDLDNDGAMHLDLRTATTVTRGLW